MDSPSANPGPQSLLLTSSFPHETLSAIPTADPIAEILQVFRSGEQFLVCSHSRPDGDAVGSMLATGMLLRQMGKRVDLLTADRIPAIYRMLPDADDIRTVLRVHGPYDAVVLLECDSLTRTRLKPNLMAGGYGQFTFHFNYWGPTGCNRDTHVLVRKLPELKW